MRNTPALDVIGNEPVLRTLMGLLGRKPVPFALGYFLLSCGGIVVLGLITGHLLDNSYSPAMYKDYAEMFELGLLAPLGAAILVNLCNRIDHLIPDLQESGALLEASKRVEGLVNRAQRLYRNTIVLFLAFALAGGWTWYAALQEPNSWDGVNGGITAYYYRFWAATIYYIIIVAVYKWGVTMWMIGKLADMRLRLQPMHPDRCGGMSALGVLPMEANYLVGIIVMFLAVEAFATLHTSGGNLGFFVVFGVFVIASFLMPFVALAKVSRNLRAQKREILLQLHHRYQKPFETYVSRLSEHADNSRLVAAMQALDEQRQIISKIPVIPVDLKSWVKYATTIVIPAVLMAIQLVIGLARVSGIVDKVRTLLGM